MDPSTPDPPTATTGPRWGFLAMIAACCAGPMLIIVVLVTVLGLAIGPAAAITLGLVAAATCVALMLLRHRHRPGGHRPGEQP